MSAASAEAVLRLVLGVRVLALALPSLHACLLLLLVLVALLSFCWLLLLPFLPAWLLRILPLVPGCWLLLAPLSAGVSG